MWSDDVNDGVGPHGTKMPYASLNIYRISSNSSRPPNRPRPRIDRVRRLEASEIQRALELSVHYIINA